MPVLVVDSDILVKPTTSPSKSYGLEAVHFRRGWDYINGLASGIVGEASPESLARLEHSCFAPALRNVASRHAADSVLALDLLSRAAEIEGRHCFTTINGPQILAHRLLQIAQLDRGFSKAVALPILEGRSHLSFQVSTVTAVPAAYQRIFAVRGVPEDNSIFISAVSNQLATGNPFEFCLEVNGETGMITNVFSDPNYKDRIPTVKAIVAASNLLSLALVKKEAV